MSDSFKGTGHTVLQPGDVFVPVSLKLNAASASTANDGSMPYGSTVVSAAITAHDIKGNNVSTNMIVATTESGNTIYAYLKYTTGLASGMHHLTAKVTLSVSGRSTNMTREYDLNRIYVKDM